MYRRLPIYFLVDVSESMVGDPLSGVEEGMASIIKSLKSDPYALETVYISIIVFAGKSKVLMPLTDIISFYPPKFSIGSGTSLGSGLTLLMDEMKKNHVVTTQEVKGDWRPIVFLFTDGVPTDSSSAAISSWKSRWGGKSNLVAISFGDTSAVSVLKELTDEVYFFNNTNVDAYKRFFKWVTASIQVSSVALESGKTSFQLAKSGDGFLEKVDLEKPDRRDNEKLDTNFAIFHGKCQNTHAEYLVKYRKVVSDSDGFEGYGLSSRHYKLVGAYPINSEYAVLSSKGSLSNSISSEEIEGVPACPSCGNQWGMSICVCGGVHCTGSEAISTCPWCGNTGKYGFGNDPINVNRKQG